MRKLLVLVTIIIATFSCSSDDDDANVVTTINYGTSFGECFGYCINKISVTELKVVLEKTGWTFNEALPKIVCEEETTDTLLDELLQKVELDAFYELDDVIGCPDCADGGAEWVEIITADKTHIVTFDYLDEPTELQELIEALRTISNSLQKEAYIIVDETLYDETEIDNYNIQNVVLEEGILKVTINSSGCDGNSWIANLVDSGDISESSPVQRSLKLNLVNQEECLAEFTRTYEFDLSKIQVDQETVIVLNIAGWNEPINYEY